jgi:Relaxase/Mobilisation nuclease domain
METDEDESLTGIEATEQLLDRWGLELDGERPGADLQVFSRRKAPKLFHKVTFSMPPGTSPAKVLGAVRGFAREELALMHRYAMVLHTDEPHTHVHLVIKSLSEQGTRVRIDKATLREWRRRFAQQLEARGVPANATQRAVRGKTLPGKSDGVLRTGQRQESHHMRVLVDSVVRDVLNGKETPEPGRARLLATRRAVEHGWRAASELLNAQGYPDLALEVRRFVAQLPPVKTERELISEHLRKRIRAARAWDDAPAR